MSYIRIWIHIVFSTKRREKLLSPELKEQIISHILENARIKGIFIDCINGSADHLHVLISLGFEQSISKIIQLIKGESSFWVNQAKITRSRFEWADEYFAVSVSESQVEAVRTYINNQEEHHRKKCFSEEVEEFIRKYGFKYIWAKAQSI